MELCSNCGKEKGTGNYCGSCGQLSGSTNSPPPFQQAYQPPQFQQQYGYAQYPPASGRTNSLAIAALVVSLICCAPLGVIFGHVALSQINKTGEGGRGLAIAGLVIGYVSCALSVIYFIAAFAAASSGY